MFLIMRGMRSGAAQPGSLSWINDVIGETCPDAAAFDVAPLQSGVIEVRIAGVASARDLAALQDALQQGAPCGQCFRVSMAAARPTADGLNLMQDRAMREIQQRDAEIERLRAELAEAHAEQERLERESEARLDGMKTARAAGLESVRIAADLRDTLDEQTRFLAGLNLQDHPTAEQRLARELVHKAMAALRPAGADVDYQAAECRFIDERFGAPHMMTTKPKRDSAPLADLKRTVQGLLNEGKLQLQPLAATRDRLPKWPSIRFDCLHGVVHASSMLIEHEGDLMRGVPLALKADFDEREDGGFSRACERLREALRHYVDARADRKVESWASAVGVPLKE